MLIQLIHESVVHMASGIPNPLNGILPDFTVFGAQFTALWQKLLAGVWGIAIVVSVVFVIVGIVEMGGASNTQNPQDYKHGRKRVVVAGVSLGCLAALAVIVGAVLAVFG
jgi:hypothetical protein